MDKKTLKEGDNSFERFENALKKASPKVSQTPQAAMGDVPDRSG